MNSGILHDNEEVRKLTAFVDDAMFLEASLIPCEDIVTSWRSCHDIKHREEVHSGTLRDFAGCLCKMPHHNINKKTGRRKQLRRTSQFPEDSCRMSDASSIELECRLSRLDDGVRAGV
ncbi:hypothetical protein MRB53_037296 [Persea americana]|nr:hypothetical protein MRB53_037296 [Persea americana]